jgi:hypothetical protein
VLAYVFWHRPKADVDPAAYEGAQRAFHQNVNVPSACFRLTRLPFAQDGGYEDWYLVDGWAELGALNDTAIDAARRTDHDRAAGMAASGWGSVYELVRGPAEIPAGINWRDKERGRPTGAFLDSLDADAIWRRQLVLGPAPEFCLSAPTSDRRVAIGLN